MLAKLAEAGATARVATAGLAVGLITLGGLALWSSFDSQRTTAHVRQINETSEQWSRVFNQVNVADNAMRDFVRMGTDITRQPLVSSVGAGQDALIWLQRNGTPDDIEAADRVAGLYGDYTILLQDLIALAERGDTAGMALHTDQAALAFTSLRKQLAAVIQAKRLETTEYLRAADSHNQRLRFAQVSAFAVNVALVGLFGLVLLGHRRKILRQAAKNEHEARHDALTGVANRALLAERLSQAIQDGEQRGATVSLLLIDLDRFKEVNDTLGHHCGDLLLRQVATRLSSAVRENDTVARLGGDEFAVLLPYSGSISVAAQVAEHLHDVLGTPVQVDDLSLEVDASIGVAAYPVDATDPDELFRHADIAMYAAKRSGLGVAVYEPSLHEHSTVQLTVVSELRRAIERDELVLHYQPKALAHNGTICGVEALARWQHPQRGLLEPSLFIPAAEDGALIEPLTRHVLDGALAQCRAWLLSGQEIPVSVNVGARCLHHPRFPDQVEALLTKHELPPRMLTLEITERAIISDPNRAKDALHRLKELGVRLSIDDFGTGYFSIAALRTMRVHEMKLDRSFVTDMCSDSANGAIVRALLDLARTFDLQVVAEGVEDHQTWSALAALGCDVVQGYYLSKPLPATDFLAWLHKTAGSRSSPGEARAGRR
jgi:diguanylate cyclase (GGDEF)-like protein